MTPTVIHSVAQLDSIPPEILCRIFEFISCDCPCTIPPDVREPPWLLGHVCSHWRKVSRSIRSLWKTDIIVFGEALNTFPPASGSNLPTYQFRKRSFAALEGAISLLPPGSHIAIEVAPFFDFIPESDSISSQDAVKIIPHIKELRWRLPLNPAIFPPGSLAEIEQLSIIPDPAFVTQNGLAALSADQFGPSPRLQKLNILTLAPHFLSSGIPLSRLRCLTLDAIHPCTRRWPTDHSVWRDFFMSRSNDFSNLHEISVVAGSKLVEIILQANLPWHQFTLFNLVLDGSFTSLSPLLDRLRLSTHLINLGIFSTKHEPAYYRDDNPVTLPFLQTLEAGSDIPFSLVKHWIFSSNLLCLNVEISLSNLYSVLRQSPHLMKVTCSLSPSTDLVSSVYSPSIVLPYLTHLSLTLHQGQEWSSASFPTLLIAPDLTSLEITVKEGYGSFPLNFTMDLINRSRARLSSIECYFEGPIPLEPNESIISLLNALKNADTVDISNFILSHAVLDSFAKGDLLPRVRSLTLSVLTLKQFVSTINKRLSYEETCGSIRLRNIVGLVYDLYDENVADDRDPDLDPLTAMIAVQEIKERYGVKCDIDNM